jgi:hypothetical protein
MSPRHRGIFYAFVRIWRQNKEAVGAHYKTIELSQAPPSFDLSLSQGSNSDQIKDTQDKVFFTFKPEICEKCGIVVTTAVSTANAQQAITRSVKG